MQPAQSNGVPTGDVELLELAREVRAKLGQAVAVRVVGQESVVELMMLALLARGHVLLVGVPGLAKTLLVASLAEALEMSFGRVQFTPDLLPADITGTDVLQDEATEAASVRRVVRFLPGPIFHNLVLADEINRTPPKTQAALLQAMQERRVTVGTQTHALPDPFQVFATRNPIEQEGTYPLPEAQLDRFLLEVHVDYPSLEEEREIARRTTGVQIGSVPHVLSSEEVRALQALVPRVPVTEEAVELAVSLARATRPADPKAPREVRDLVRFGSGPRGPQALVLAAKARAALRGEAAADIDDVRALVVPVLRHRLVLSYRAEVEGVRDLDIIDRVVKAVGA
ncbi:MAG TPA: MoxR family ATPase [Polyangiaceae bacterium]|nr:MoxR family ATPase [Polyangiaceae bacterium]